MSEVKLNTEKNRFELDVEGATAVIEFRKIEPNILDLIHTEVPEALSGKGIASKLVLGALNYIRSNNLKLIPSCSFVQSYMNKHQEWNDLLLEENRK